MSTDKTWRQRLAAVLEWSPVDKGQMMLMMLIPILCQYQLWAFYVLQRDDREQLINVAVLRTLIWHEATMLAVSVSLVLLGLWLRRRSPDRLWFQHLAAQFYAVVLCYLGYHIGLNELSTGIVLLGAPLFGFIVLDRTVVWLGTATGLALTLSLNYASALGLIPYAPVMQPAADAASQLFHLHSILIFAAPHFIFILLLADQTLHWWRRREDTIRVLSRTDMLTGLANRLAVMEMLEKEVARTLRHGPPLAVVILDLDHFKRINDTWGHPTGDRVLKEAARVLGASIRKTDVVGRYGGEEFMIVLPNTTLAGAIVLIERCREQLANTVIMADNGERVPISASFGLVDNEDDMSLDAEVLIKAADEALYQAKHDGRNRVVVGTPVAA